MKSLSYLTTENLSYSDRSLEEPTLVRRHLPALPRQPTWVVEDQATGLRYTLPKLSQPWSPWQLAGVLETNSRVQELLLLPAKPPWPAGDEPPEPTP